MARILLIEDEEDVRYSLCRALEEGKHEVFEAADGEEALSQYRKMVACSQTTDVIITDILMPNKHGFDAITEIMEISPDAKIIAISGGGNVDPKVLLEMSQFLGATRVLAKPFPPEELLQAVNDCLDKSKD